MGTVCANQPGGRGGHAICKSKVDAVAKFGYDVGILDVVFDLYITFRTLELDLVDHNFATNAQSVVPMEFFRTEVSEDCKGNISC